MSRKYTPEMLEWLKNNVFGKTCKDIQEEFNQQFKTNRTLIAIRSILKRYNLKNHRRELYKQGMLSPSEISFKRKYPLDFIAWLRENALGKSYKELFAEANKKFPELNLKQKTIPMLLKNYKITTGRTGYYKKGEAPWNKGKRGYMGANKTSFKKGNIPWNYRPLGSVRLSKDGYIIVKEKEKTWSLLHVAKWEEEHGKKVGKGNVIIFKDGDKRNFNSDNLVLISRKELLLLNQDGLSEFKELNSSRLLVAKVKAANYQLSKERRKQNENKKNR